MDYLNMLSEDQVSYWLDVIKRKRDHLVMPFGDFKKGEKFHSDKKVLWLVLRDVYLFIEDFFILLDNGPIKISEDSIQDYINDLENRKDIEAYIEDRLLYLAAIDYQVFVGRVMA